MKKKIFVGFFLLIIGLFSMFFFDICPPVGPWPMPPWCTQGFVKNTYTVNVQALPLSQIKAVNMVDTWGRNYNMSMFEDTRNNIASSFDRVQALGAQEVYVHDFHRAIFKKGADYTTTDYTLEDETFWNDFRDQSITFSELKTLVTEAHNRGLKLGIKHNMAFVNIGKYILKGISGKIQNEVEHDYQTFNAEHSPERIKDYFAKRQARLLEKGKIYQVAGVDIMSISPTWMEPIFPGQERLANSLQKQLIAELRKVFTGKIYVEVSRFGFLEGKDGQVDWNVYDFYKDADIVELRVYDLPVPYRFMDMKSGIKKYFETLDALAAKKGIRLSIFFAPSSYSDSLRYGVLEVLDYRNEKVKNTVPDFEYQTQVFDAFFSVILNMKHIERINVASFAWDDALDPQVKPRLSVASTFRNKPAEVVIQKWFTAH